MEANGAIWALLQDRQNAQGRRIDTLEVATQSHADQSLRVEETTNERLGNVERDVASIKTTLKIVAGFVAILTPVATVVLGKVIG